MTLRIREVTHGDGSRTYYAICADCAHATRAFPDQASAEASWRNHMCRD